MPRHDLKTLVSVQLQQSATEKMNRKPADVAKRERTRFYQFEKRFYRAGLKLHKECQVEVHGMVRKNSRITVLSTTTIERSPFSEQVLVCVSPVFVEFHLTVDRNRAILHPNGYFRTIFRISKPKNSSESTMKVDTLI
jgi:hypothetical protein